MIGSHSLLKILTHTHRTFELPRPTSMSFLVNPFSYKSREGAAWFCAGPASSYPDVDDTTRVGEQRLCRDKFTPGCRIFHVPREDSSKAVEVSIDDWKSPDSGDSKDQVMIFRYNGKFVAINHVCLLFPVLYSLTPCPTTSTVLYKALFPLFCRP